jgi:hypothetical protein
MISASFLNQVGGTLSQQGCETIAKAALTVPDEGVILDINCGEGRSTLSMALALDTVERDGVSILAIDTHVIDPKSSTPHEDGTILKFLKNLRNYRALHRVVPMVMPVSKVRQVLNRKCANMVIIQAPVSDLTSISQDIEIAKFALRAKGIIVVCLQGPNATIWDGLRLVLPETEYTMLHNSRDLRIYESGKKGG